MHDESTAVGGRKTWAYRLVVTIPNECLAADFVPDALIENEQYRDWDEQPFTWPRRRLYFSLSSACRRAHLLSTWGATVTIERALVEQWSPVYIYRPGEMGAAVKPASAPERVLTAIGRLQDETARTWVEPLVSELVSAMAADTTAVELRQEIEFLRAESAIS